ncbi:uncharacterized protein LOC129946918 isoform X2 [Eupeodes corollae]|uniref:uncharacterized protein LOC129946918 isoform X2 n=1 Tax=Eupeodes corollae TaxID=290404 RepID=UPI002491FA12|nr:uncharacterized protein LOC129946918 isoform X2 [Eupeodes corollae]
MKKRVRSVNFTIPETELLISLIESKINIVESKKCDAITWQEKEFTWKTIETDFNNLNTSGEVYRDAKCLRLKFDSLKRDTRKKERIIQYERYNLGSYCGKNINTTHKFTDLEKRIKEMIVPSVPDSSPDSDHSQSDVKNLIPLPEPNEDKSAIDEDLGNNEIQYEEYEEFEEKPFQNLTSENLEVPEVCFSASPKSPLPKPTKNTIKLHSRFGNYSRKGPVIKNKNKLKKQRFVEEALKDAKLEIVNLQKQLLQQEIKKEIAQTKVFQQELDHKKQFQELERQHLILKMQLTRAEIANAKK